MNRLGILAIGAVLIAGSSALAVAQTNDHRDGRSDNRGGNRSFNNDRGGNRGGNNVNRGGDRGGNNVYRGGDRGGNNVYRGGDRGGNNVYRGGDRGGNNVYRGGDRDNRGGQNFDRGRDDHRFQGGRPNGIYWRDNNRRFDGDDHGFVRREIFVRSRPGIFIAAPLFVGEQRFFDGYYWYWDGYNWCRRDNGVVFYFSF